MRLSRYKDFIKESKEDIDSICKEYGITNYTINDDESIDVSGNIDLSYEELTKLPFKFRNVSGYFNCSRNQLTSLEGCPNNVGGYFDCGDSELTSLQGCPQSIGGEFYCSDNEIMDFKGFPEYYEGNSDFTGNPVFEILKLFNYNLKCIDWINEHDVIQVNKIILQRLEEVAYELRMELPENLTFENYEII